MTSRKKLGFGIAAVGILAIAAYLFWTQTKPPESARKIADAAFKTYCEQNHIPLNAYPLRRSGIGLGYYFFDYGTDLGLGGGFLVYRVIVWRNGLTEVKGTSIMDRFWLH